MGRGYITNREQTRNELRANRGRGAGKPGTNRGQTGNEARAKAGETPLGTLLIRVAAEPEGWRPGGSGPGGEAEAGGEIFEGPAAGTGGTPGI